MRICDGSSDGCSSDLKQKIREVVTRYCRGVDRMDRDLFLSAYHPDAIDDHGFVVAGPEAFWAWVHHYHTTAQSTHQHIITNHSCELDGNIAHAETYRPSIGQESCRKRVGTYA